MAKKLAKKTKVAIPAKPEVEPEIAGNESPDVLESQNEGTAETTENSDTAGSEPAPESDTPENPEKTGAESENPENSPVAEPESESTKVSTDPENAPQNATSQAEFSETIEKTDELDKEPTLEPEPEEEVVLRNACPRCKHVSGDKAIKLGPPNECRCNLFYCVLLAQSD